MDKLFLSYGSDLLLLQLVASLTQCEHMTDVVDAVNEVLKRAGVQIEWSTLSELGAALGRMGITTLRGTSLS